MAKTNEATLNEMSELFRQTAARLAEFPPLAHLTADERLYATRFAAHYLASDLREFCAKHGQEGLIEAWAMENSLGLKKGIPHPPKED